MEKVNLIVLSTAHLHPLEAKVIDKLSYLSNEFLNLLVTDEEMCQVYENEYDCPCIADTLRTLRDKYNAEYVLFDAGANVTPELKLYNW